MKNIYNSYGHNENSPKCCDRFFLVDAAERISSQYEAQRNAVLAELQPLLCDFASRDNVGLSVKTYFFKELSSAYALLKSRRKEIYFGNGIMRQYVSLFPMENKWSPWKIIDMH